MEKRKRRARIFALGFAAMFMLSAVIVGVTLSVRNQSPAEGTITTNPLMEWTTFNIAMSPSPLSLVVHSTLSGPTVGFPSGGTTTINTSGTMNHSGGGQANITIHGTVLLPSLSAGFSWDAGPSVVFSGTITAFWNPSGGTWHGDWDIGTRTFSTSDVTATVEFRRPNGTTITTVSQTGPPNSPQTFTITPAQAGTPPANHTWGNLSVTRNIGNGGALTHHTITQNPINVTVTATLRNTDTGATVPWSNTGIQNGNVTINAQAWIGTPVIPDNHSFDGWSPASITVNRGTGGNAGVLDFTPIFTPLAPTIYLATFYLHGGKIAEYTDIYTMPVVDGMRVPQPRNPIKTGYSFKGWFTEQYGGELFNFITPRNSNQTIHAQWEPISGNVVILHFAGGLTHNETVWYFNTGRPYTLRLPGADIMNQRPPVSGQVFLGWFDNVERVGVPVVLIPGDASGPQLLFALWG